MLLTADGYRESLRAYSPRVFVDGQRIDSVADSPVLAPGINAIGVTYDLAHDSRYRHLMTATGEGGREVNRMVHIDTCADDLLHKLEAVRLVCQESGCAQRYLVHDGLSALYQATFDADALGTTDYHQRLVQYLTRVQLRWLDRGAARPG